MIQTTSMDAFVNLLPELGAQATEVYCVLDEYRAGASDRLLAQEINVRRERAGRPFLLRTSVVRARGCLVKAGLVEEAFRAKDYRTGVRVIFWRTKQ